MHIQDKLMALRLFFKLFYFTAHFYKEAISIIGGRGSLKEDTCRCFSFTADGGLEGKNGCICIYLFKFFFIIISYTSAGSS